jgi:hypothetical protein
MTPELECFRHLRDPTGCLDPAFMDPLRQLDPNVGDAGAQEAINHGSGFIYGTRRSGKTTTLGRCREQLPDTPALFIDLDAPKPSTQPLSVVEEITEFLARHAGARPLVLIDEVDVLTGMLEDPARRAHTLTLLWALRRWCLSRHIYLLMAGHIRAYLLLPELEVGEGVSGLMCNMPWFRLGDMSVGKCIELAAIKTHTQASAEAIWQFTAGHPSATTWLLKHADPSRSIAPLRDDQSAADWLLGAGVSVSQFRTRYINADFDVIEKIPNRKHLMNVLRAIAAGQNALPAPDDADILTEMGFLRRSEADGRYVLARPYLGLLASHPLVVPVREAHLERVDAPPDADVTFHWKLDGKSQVVGSRGIGPAHEALLRLLVTHPVAGTASDVVGGISGDCLAIWLQNEGLLTRESKLMVSDLKAKLKTLHAEGGIPNEIAYPILDGMFNARQSGARGLDSTFANPAYGARPTDPPDCWERVFCLANLMKSMISLEKSGSLTIVWLLDTTGARRILIVRAGWTASAGRLSLSRRQLALLEPYTELQAYIDRGRTAGQLVLPERMVLASPAIPENGWPDDSGLPDVLERTSLVRLLPGKINELLPWMRGRRFDDGECQISVSFDAENKRQLEVQSLRDRRYSADHDAVKKVLPANLDLFADHLHIFR